jgi:hypothetical protein
VFARPARFLADATVPSRESSLSVDFVPGHAAGAFAVTGSPRTALHDASRSAELKEARRWRGAAEAGDDGTNDLVVGDVIRANELQFWFVAEDVVEMPLVQAVQRERFEVTRRLDARRSARRDVSAAPRISR